MPKIFYNHSVNTSDVVSDDTLYRAMTVLNYGEKPAGLVLNLPFRTRLAPKIRLAAKEHGARWDGKEWILPYFRCVVPSVEKIHLDHGDLRERPPMEIAGTALSPAATWCREKGLVMAIKTYTYIPWKWNAPPKGKYTHDLALDISFENRNLAKEHGAKWDAVSNRWYLPVARITKSAIDALNAAEAIEDPGQLGLPTVVASMPAQLESITTVGPLAHASSRIMKSADLAWNTLLRCCDKTVCPVALEEIFEISCDTIEANQSSTSQPLWKSMHWLVLNDADLKTSVLIGFAPQWATSPNWRGWRGHSDDRIHALKSVNMFGFVIPLPLTRNTLFSVRYSGINAKGYSKELMYAAYSQVSASPMGHRNWKNSSDWKWSNFVPAHEIPFHVERARARAKAQSSSDAANHSIQIKLFGFSKQNAQSAYEALANIYKARPCQPDHPYVLVT